MVQIKYYKSNSVQTVISFKILNDVIVCILLIQRIKSKPGNEHTKKFRIGKDIIHFHELV